MWPTAETKHVNGEADFSVTMRHGGDSKSRELLCTARFYLALAYNILQLQYEMKM